MNNVKLAVSGKKLTITIDLGVEGEASKSGKSVVLATTKGNVPVPQHEELKLGLNLFRVSQ